MDSHQGGTKLFFDKSPAKRTIHANGNSGTEVAPRAAPASCGTSLGRNAQVEFVGGVAPAWHQGGTKLFFDKSSAKRKIPWPPLALFKILNRERGGMIWAGSVGSLEF